MFFFVGVNGEASAIPTVGNKIRVWDITSKSPEVRFYIDSGYDTVQALAESSFSEWQGVPDAYIRFKKLDSISHDPNATNYADIWIHVVGELSNSFAGAQARVSVDSSTGYIQQCTVEIPSRSANSLIKGIILHEIGHCLGLVHSVVNKAVMSYRGGSILTTDDKFVLAQLYPEDSARYPLGCATVRSVDGSSGGSGGSDRLFTFVAVFLMMWGMRKMKQICGGFFSIGFILSMGILSGCSGVPGGGSPEGFAEQIKKEWATILRVLPGGRSQEAAPKVVVSARASVPPESRHQAHAELLREMFLVIFRLEPREGDLFSSYLASLDQGSSFEGIYNGFTHSAHYRDLETRNPGPVPERALVFFVEQLADIEMLLPEKTNFTARSAEPLAPMMSMSEMELGAGTEDGQKIQGQTAGVSVVEFGKKKKKSHPKATEVLTAPTDPMALAKYYQKIFEKASVYTLKRVLSDEALKLIETMKSSSPEGLSRWYGTWAAGMNRYGVTYGLVLRSRADANFHEQWALKAEPDALTWEVLNRIHRTLNQLQQQEQK